MKRERLVAGTGKELFRKYPVLTITGPRQSGKTTFVKQNFPDLPYANLEDLEAREFARADPKGFLRSLGDRAIIDEIQNVPDLTSTIQVEIDQKGGNGHYVLTGSRHFKVMESLTQSLAGRSALLTLLPFSLEEALTYRKMLSDGKSLSIEKVLYTGFYPRIFDNTLNPTQALGDYYTTYVERDVRQLVNVKNLMLFSKFIRLLAGRVGSLLNLSSVARDAGISHATAQEWITILQASYIIYLLPPFFANIRKRLVKSPKIYFYDVGLASYLLGVEKEQHLISHPLKGNLFENFVVMDFLKHRMNRGLKDNLHFYRDSQGREVDLLVPVGTFHSAIEIKSGETMNSSFLDNLRFITEAVSTEGSYLVYGGSLKANREGTHVAGWADLPQLLNEHFAG